MNFSVERLFEFAGNHPELFLALGVILGFLIWTEVRARFQGWHAIGPVEATQLINHKDAVVLDIRENREFHGGSILHSVHVPLSELKDKLERLEKYKDRPVVVSCRSGSRSGVACATLKKNGFDEVYNLKGGILAWQNASLPLTMPNKKK